MIAPFREIISEKSGFNYLYVNEHPSILSQCFDVGKGGGGGRGGAEKRRTKNYTKGRDFARREKKGVAEIRFYRRKFFDEK